MEQGYLDLSLDKFQGIWRPSIAFWLSSQETIGPSEDITYITPFVQMMQPTLNLASKFQPEFVQVGGSPSSIFLPGDHNIRPLEIFGCASWCHQVITWNDYSEGTMVEPSWVRPRNTCLSACAAEVSSCKTTDACHSGFDPLDCTKPYNSFSGPVDPAWLGVSKISSCAAGSVANWTQRSLLWHVLR